MKIEKTEKIIWSDKGVSLELRKNKEIFIIGRFLNLKQAKTLHSLLENVINYMEDKNKNANN